MKTKIQKLQARLDKVNKEIKHAQNGYNDISSIKNGERPNTSFWNSDLARQRIDTLLEVRDSLMIEIATLSNPKCTIL